MSVNSSFQSTVDILSQLSKQQASLESYFNLLKGHQTGFINELSQQTIIKMNAEVLFAEKDQELKVTSKKIEDLNIRQEVAESKFFQLSSELEKVIELAKVSKKVDDCKKANEMNQELNLHLKELSQIEKDKSQIVLEIHNLLTEKLKASLDMISAENQINFLPPEIKELENKLKEVTVKIEEIIAQKKSTTKSDVCILAGNQDQNSILSLFSREIIMDILAIKANILQ